MEDINSLIDNITTQKEVNYNDIYDVMNSIDIHMETFTSNHHKRPKIYHNQILSNFLSSNLTNS